MKGLSLLKGFDRLSLPSKDSFNLGTHVLAVCFLITAVHFPAFSAPSTSLLLPLPTSILHAGAVHEFFPSTLAPSLLPLATSLGSLLRRGGRMRRSPVYRQLDNALCSSPSKPLPFARLPLLRVRVAGRARTLAQRLPISGRSSKERGAGLSFWCPAQFGPAFLPRLRAPARSPSWNWEEEGEGDRDETRVVVGKEAETKKRRGSEFAGTAFSCNLSATLRRE